MRQNALYAAAQLERKLGRSEDARQSLEQAYAAYPDGALSEEALAGLLDVLEGAGVDAELRPNAIWPAFRKAWRRRGLGVSCRKRRPFDLADAPAPCKQHPTRAPTRASISRCSPCLLPGPASATWSWPTRRCSFTAQAMAKLAPAMGCAARVPARTAPAVMPRVLQRARPVSAPRIVARTFANRTAAGSLPVPPTWGAPAQGCRAAGPPPVAISPAIPREPAADPCVPRLARPARCKAIAVVDAVTRTSARRPAPDAEWRAKPAQPTTSVAGVSAVWSAKASVPASCKAAAAWRARPAAAPPTAARDCARSAPMARPTARPCPVARSSSSDARRPRIVALACAARTGAAKARADVSPRTNVASPTTTVVRAPAVPSPRAFYVRGRTRLQGQRHGMQEDRRLLRQHGRVQRRQTLPDGRRLPTERPGMLVGWGLLLRRVRAQPHGQAGLPRCLRPRGRAVHHPRRLLHGHLRRLPRALLARALGARSPRRSACI